MPVKSGNDDDIVPDSALVKTDDTYHGGRGGQGNAVVAGELGKKEKGHEGLADKLKSKGAPPAPCCKVQAADCGVKSVCRPS